MQVRSLDWQRTRRVDWAGTCSPQISDSRAATLSQGGLSNERGGLTWPRPSSSPSRDHRGPHSENDNSNCDYANERQDNCERMKHRCPNWRWPTKLQTSTGHAALTRPPAPVMAKPAGLSQRAFFAGRARQLMVPFATMILGVTDATGRTNLAAHRCSKRLCR